MKVMIELLTRKLSSIILCDAWRPYPKFTKRMHRCWAHLLRESKDHAEKNGEAIPLHKVLGQL